jgi:hypothetical protein
LEELVVLFIAVLELVEEVAREELEFDLLNELEEVDVVELFLEWGGVGGGILDVDVFDTTGVGCDAVVSLVLSLLFEE